MKSLNDPLFQKNELFNLSSVVGGSKTTTCSSTYQSNPDGTGHYKCDHSPDPTNQQ